MFKCCFLWLLYAEVNFSSLQGQWVSMGVPSDGSYGIDKGLIYSFPVEIASNHTYKIVQDLAISEFSRGKMDATHEELKDERETALAACM